ncbi:gliding motility-associated C-terminal domain-containing protein [Chitinophaga sp.]|uniref:T9SS type B sorting domain-containing protein n=1 Tax=Chitinophaga sp. TaxID=1869181 RepID=UPI002D1AC709|nr:gliding motility-associated C-terminal domain-containing protein [Chitinophaga sp.]HWV69191.1 gliding motility-associated C-terminal domain-containing protein [Chitinophaga sp.]
MHLLFRITLIFCLILFVSSTKAAIFIVTSKADAGPGTLRDAINQANANGTTVVDYIHFNLPGSSVDDRTIRIIAELPALSSNIELDGTTQPDAAFGISDAKIRLLKENYFSNGNFFNILSIRDAEHVNIYGIDLEIPPGWFTSGGYCLNITESSHITIGAPGKGNVMNASDGLISSGVQLTQGNATDLHIAYNLLGVNPDGVSIPIYMISYPSIILWGTGNVEMDHNQICAYTRIEEYYSALVPLGKRNYNVHDNIGGGDYTGSNKIGNASFTITTYPRTDITGDNAIEVKNNHILEGYFALGGGYGTVLLQGNKINTDVTGAIRTGRSYANFSVELFRVKSAFIGGNQQSEKNYISGLFGGVSCSYDDHVTISKNSFFCNGKGIQSKETVFVESFTGTTVSGTSEADAVIEVFDADNCSGTQGGCEGKVYLGRTVADAGGKWSYSGALPENVVVTGTNKEGSTSEFTRATINTERIEVTPSFCGKPGSIKGIAVTGAVVIQWEDASGNIVGRDAELPAILPGTYTLWANTNNNPHGKCAVSSYIVTILDVKPSLTNEQMTLVKPCNDNNGAISNITDHANAYTKQYKWLNEKDEIVGTGPDLTKVPAGTYRLYAYITDDCFAISAPIVLTNQQPPSINQSSATVTAATCSNSNGAVSGIDITGIMPYTFRWLNEADNVVSTGLELKNIPQGEYRLELTDNSGCVPVMGTPIEVDDIGTISLDAANIKITPAGCGGQGGAISGLLVAGADTYTWRNEAGSMVGTNIELKDIPEGNYQLTATNNFSCNAQTMWYKISKTQPTQWLVQGEIQFPTCNETDGAILINNITGNTIKSLKWVNTATSNVIGTDRNVMNVGPGNYALYIIDENDCEQLAYTTEVPQRRGPLLSGPPMVTDETCGQANGGIQAPVITGEGPFRYRWTDENGVEKGNGTELKGIKKGAFTLTVTDKYGCVVNSGILNVNNNASALPAPGDLYYIIAKGQPLELKWSYSTAVVFTLYADPGLNRKVNENNTGVFTLPLQFADTKYYVTASMDICTSTIATAYITVVDKTDVYIPTAFSPNGDGQNDIFRPRYTGIVSIDYFKVFDRWGKLVFSSNTLGAGWDGQRSPMGSYIYVISGKDLLGKTFLKRGSVLLIR